MRHFCLIVLGVLLAESTLAQESVLITDRPSNTNAALLTVKGSFIWEYGFLREHASDNLSTTTFANNLLKYGLTKRVELRLVVDYLQIKSDESTQSDFASVVLGSKIHLIDGSGALPQTSIVGQVSIPETGGFDSNPASEFRLNCSNSIAKKATLAYNLGVALEFDQGTESRWLYTINYIYAFSSTFSMFIEQYSFIQNDIDFRADAGLVYLIHPHWQVDLSYGIGLSDISPDNYLGLGLSALIL